MEKKISLRLRARTNNDFENVKKKRFFKEIEHKHEQ